MIELIYGADRQRAEQAVRKIVGATCEVLEGESLQVSDLPNIFLGKSLLAEKRVILLKNLQDNSAVWAKLGDFLDTEHKIVIWEDKLDKRTATYKALKARGVKMTEFPLLRTVEDNLVFNILDVAFRDGKKAVMMCEQIENGQDPYRFLGLLVSQALKKFEYRQGTKEKRVLKELSKLDRQMKSTAMQEWTLLKAFLLRVSAL